jgi:hypothetical protein
MKQKPTDHTNGKISPKFAASPWNQKLETHRQMGIGKSNLLAKIPREIYSDWGWRKICQIYPDTPRVIETIFEICPQVIPLLVSYQLPQFLQTEINKRLQTRREK